MKINLLNPSLYLIYIFMFLTALDGLIIPTLVAGIIHSVEIKSFSSLINYFIFGIVGYCIIRTALYLWNLYQQKFIKDFNNTYKGQVIQKYFTGNNSTMRADLLSFIVNDFKFLETNYIKSLFLFIYCVTFSIVSATYVLVIDYKLGLLFIAFSIIPIITPKIYKNKIKLTTDQWSHTSSQFVNRLNEYFSALTTIRVFSKQPFFQSSLTNGLNRVEDSNYEMQKTLFQSNWLTNLLSGISAFVPLFIGGLFVIEGNLSLAALMAVYLASDRIVIPAVNAIDHYNKLRSSNTIVHKYNNFITSLTNDQDGIKNSSNTVNHILPVKFLHVSHRYGDRVIFNDVHLTINKGEHIVLKGSSGSGKSTFFKLLLLLEKPHQGQLLFDNADAQQISFFDMMQHIHYFEQTPFIFNDSLLFNITLGEAFDEDKLNKVIEQCKLNELVQTQGLDYNVGVNGEHLSGGQKMRVALARIMIRNPEFVLLDEFSAGLDIENATFIREMIHKNIETVIEITHDENIDDKFYDKTFRITDGEIVEVK
ncbi:ATP-binding cassette domain-containing protein [Staphylococcus ratti]|uniref:ABC transporter ATP-binding protein/permease n=1 Tax=Staphylococcus ratti TaxID=2892440 RepID=A0ABY3PAD6_9STAP|nr:ABC transporter ATP-binding protein [Staphylococcus ratti]UEX89258.1 ABC transporter ATP-binding protein/permease [Staphylococcus ratti]